MDASQLLTVQGVLPLLGWLGLALVGLSVLMTLLDWGDLSGLTPQSPPRRRPAVACGAIGGALLVLGGVGALLLG